MTFTPLNSSNCYNSSIDFGEGASEQDHAWSTLIHVVLVIACFFAAFILYKLKSIYVSASGASLMIGIVGGIFVRYGITNKAIEMFVSFNQQTFFLYVLPPIMFEAGLSVNRQAFIVNIVSILSLAFVGVLINTAVFGGLLYGVSVLGWSSPSLSLLECLLFGSIISATDPVTVLSVFGALKVDADLYANVFGESALNDAVAIVLFRTLSHVGDSVTASVVLTAIGRFAYIFLGSFAIGVAFAVAIALILKYTDFAKNPQIELGIILALAYASYLLPDALELSGIVSTLACGFFFAHYAEPNLQGSTIFSRGLFVMLAFIAETQAFTSLGIGIWNDTSLRWSGSLIGWSIAFCLIARAIMVPAICYPVSWLRPSLPITWQHQVMIWHAGLRGALAFSLTFTVTTKHAAFIATTTVAIIASSIIVLGGTSITLLDLLHIRRGHAAHGDEQRAPSWVTKLLDFDQRHVVPALCGKLFITEAVQIGEH